MYLHLVVYIIVSNIEFRVSSVLSLEITSAVKHFNISLKKEEQEEKQKNKSRGIYKKKTMMMFLIQTFLLLFCFLLPFFYETTKYRKDRKIR